MRLHGSNVCFYSHSSLVPNLLDSYAYSPTVRLLPPNNIYPASCTNQTSLSHHFAFITYDDHSTLQTIKDCTIQSANPTLFALVQNWATQIVSVWITDPQPSQKIFRTLLDLIPKPSALQTPPITPASGPNLVLHPLEPTAASVQTIPGAAPANNHTSRTPSMTQGFTPSPGVTRNLRGRSYAQPTVAGQNNASRASSLRITLPRSQSSTRSSLGLVLSPPASAQSTPHDSVSPVDRSASSLVGLTSDVIDAGAILSKMSLDAKYAARHEATPLRKLPIHSPIYPGVQSECNIISNDQAVLLEISALEARLDDLNGFAKVAHLATRLRRVNLDALFAGIRSEQAQAGKRVGSGCSAGHHGRSSYTLHKATVCSK